MIPYTDENKISEIKRLCNKLIDVWRNHNSNNEMDYGRVWGAAIASEAILSILECDTINENLVKSEDS